MKIHSVSDKAFKRYGQVLEGYDFTELLKVLIDISPKPKDGAVYKASNPEFEVLPIAKELQNRGFGGLPIQIGYCNGTNSKLNCLEYHRNSEFNIAADDVILLLGCQADLEDYALDTEKVEAFLLLAGTGVELFATTLHYVPCGAKVGEGFRVVNVLPKGTNGEKPDGLLSTGEDRLCMGLNKWLLAHEEADEASQGAFVGLIGKNIDLKTMNL
jgi:hypothetical protein